MDILIKDIIDNKTDLVFQNGDFKITPDDTEQRIALILKYNVGHLRQYPSIGVFIDRYNNGGWNSELKNDIIQQLHYDDISVKDINNKNNKLNIEL